MKTHNLVGTGCREHKQRQAKTANNQIARSLTVTSQVLLLRSQDEIAMPRSSSRTQICESKKKETDKAESQTIITSRAVVGTSKFKKNQKWVVSCRRRSIQIKRQACVVALFLSQMIIERSSVWPRWIRSQCKPTILPDRHRAKTRKIVGIGTDGNRHACDTTLYTLTIRLPSPEKPYTLRTAHVQSISIGCQTKKRPGVEKVAVEACAQNTEKTGKNSK